MGSCFTKDEDEVNPSLSGLNDSRHVMMRRASKVEQIPGVIDASAYKPRQEHKLPQELVKELEELDEENEDGGNKK